LTSDISNSIQSSDYTDYIVSW